MRLVFNSYSGSGQPRNPKRLSGATVAAVNSRYLNVSVGFVGDLPHARELPDAG